ncbi:hypothetical protein SCP_0307100 [Sparassis crispa]|uniref:Uncharacterized protein n=1 Tax=Sparassis crispa TaxID=139825 RepID=A0A401GFM3_9APHY|nr:hypothetical protein SCP_0307100 [Sparassis crispa]GBE80987.1 hypothetical protein SCP_0307100 [Sparassis crispa]
MSAGWFVILVRGYVHPCRDDCDAKKWMRSRKMVGITEIAHWVRANEEGEVEWELVLATSEEWMRVFH